MRKMTFIDAETSKSLECWLYCVERETKMNGYLFPDRDRPASIHDMIERQPVSFATSRWRIELRAFKENLDFIPPLGVEYQGLIFLQSGGIECIC